VDPVPEALEDPDDPVLAVDGVVAVLVPVDAVDELVSLAAVVAVVDGVVAAPDASVPMPRPRPAVPAITPSATTTLRNRACMSHLPCCGRGSSRRIHHKPPGCEPAGREVGGD